MKIIGVIAEYNPFHNGHAYQIEKIKKELEADSVIVAMSGDFVQRGAPAICNKYHRAHMALSCGADLILELPVLWACASAEHFAMAAVTLFDKIGCVDGLCFGAETDCLPLLEQLADLLVEEPLAYRQLLASYLKEGDSYPLARSKALCNLVSPSYEVAAILNEPNNILALEYLKAIKRRKCSITPYLLKREGASYHEKNILENETTALASATGIRKLLLEEHAFLDDVLLAQTMPKEAVTILKSALEGRQPLVSNDFSSILGYQLLCADKDSLSQVGDCNEDIANRLLRFRNTHTAFDDLCLAAKSKDVTYTRISRILLHLLLQITNQDYVLGKELDYIPYLRILGFQKNTDLLKKIRSTATVPLISKLAHASQILDENALWLLRKDVFAAHMYEQIYALKNHCTPQNEYTKQIILRNDLP